MLKKKDLFIRQTAAAAGSRRIETRFAFTFAPFLSSRKAGNIEKKTIHTIFFCFFSLVCVCA
jgi:hypothetical protein